MISRRWFYTTLIGFGCFLLGGLAVWLALNSSILNKENIFRGNILRLNNSEYRFINPMLACDVGSEEAFPEFKPIKDKLANVINQEIKKGTAKNISVYVRSMRAGRWFEINGDKIYAPASLLKTFVMAAYYREAEDTPTILQKQTIFEGSSNPEENMPGEVIPHLTNGESYSVSQLIDQMIIYSDNDALYNLIDNADSKTFEFLNGIFSDLNIPSPLIQNENQLNFMSVTNYAMVFRVLFSTTYLSRSDSEKALELLSKAHYKEGIVAGVPSDIAVAHKFGVRSVPNTSGKIVTAQLHDCGIIYYPNHPYLLCIMTEGYDFGLLQKNIQDISQITYQELDNYFSQLPVASSTAATSSAVK